MSSMTLLSWFSSHRVSCFFKACSLHLALWALVCATAEPKTPSLSTYTQSPGMLNLSNWSLLNLYLWPPLLWTLDSDILTAYLIFPFECFIGISNLTGWKRNPAHPYLVLPQWPTYLTQSHKPKSLTSPLSFLLFSYPLPIYQQIFSALPSKYI